MERSMGTGFMAVFAVSGSVVFLAVQAHKRLLSNFMKKIDLEIKNSSGDKDSTAETKKEVRFADGEGGLSGAERNACTISRKNCNEETWEGMPQNWQAMYKGILQYRNLKANY